LSSFVALIDAGVVQGGIAGLIALGIVVQVDAP
jgi:hypothetical protein